MFRHYSEEFGKYQKHLLVNSETGSEFSVVPQCGALLLSCKIQHFELIDGYNQPSELEEQAYGKSLLLFPFPNRLNGGQFRFQNKTYSFPINDPNTGNAIHGMGFKSPFAVESVELNDTRAALTCTHHYDGLNPAFPFPFNVTVQFEMIDNQFNTVLSIENCGLLPMPAGLGWHPYFRIAASIDDCTIQLPILELVEIDKRMLPTGSQKKFGNFAFPSSLKNVNLDNCFFVPEQHKPFIAVIDSPNGTLSYSQQTGHRGFNYVQLFTPTHRKSIAVEPMSCNIDGFNNTQGLQILQPAEQLTGRCGFQFVKKIS